MGELRAAKRLFPKGESTVEKIYLATLQPDKYELSETQLNIKNRWKAAFTMSVDGKNRLEIISSLMDAYGISESQAHIDIVRSGQFYGEVNKVSVDTDRAVLRERINEVWKIAKKDGKLSEMISVIKEHFKIIEEKDPSFFNPEKFEMHELQLGIPQELLDLLMSQAANGVVDFNKFTAEDAEFVELDE